MRADRGLLRRFRIEIGADAQLATWDSTRRVIDRLGVTKTHQERGGHTAAPLLVRIDYGMNVNVTLIWNSRSEPVGATCSVA